MDAALVFGFAKKAKSGLPPQKVLISTCLKPGRKVDLVLEADPARNLVDVRSTMLYDQDKKAQLLLAQTAPRVDPNSKGKNLEVTFLARYEDSPGGRWIRVGYRAALLGVLESFEVGPSMHEPVLLVPGPKKLVPMTLRLDKRLDPPGGQSLRLYIMPEGTEVTLADISLGGARFSHPTSWSFAAQKVLDLELARGGERVAFQAKVLRSGERLLHGGVASGSTAVHFDNLGNIAKQKLSQMLNGARTGGK